MTKTPEDLAENQGRNEYDYLRNEALFLAKRGRDELPKLERAFHEAISRIRCEVAKTITPFRVDEILSAIIDYPVALRAVMDCSDVANEHLRRSESIKRAELMEK